MKFRKKSTSLSLYFNLSLSCIHGNHVIPSFTSVDTFSEKCSTTISKKDDLERSFSLSLFSVFTPVFDLFVTFFSSFSPISSSYDYKFTPAPLVPLHSKTSLFFFHPSSTSWRERTVRAAPSTVCAAIAAPTPTLLATHPLPCPVRQWSQLQQLPHSLCRSCPCRTPQMALSPSRRSQTLSRFGRSPGACMKVDVSIFLWSCWKHDKSSRKVSS